MGVRRKSWTGLCRNFKALSIFEVTEGVKRDFDALFVTPADVGVNDPNELFKSCGLLVSRVNSSVFSRPKKPSQAALSGEHPLRDIERISLALCILESQSGQR